MRLETPGGAVFRSQPSRQLHVSLPGCKAGVGIIAVAQRHSEDLVAPITPQPGLCLGAVVELTRSCLPPKMRFKAKGKQIPLETGAHLRWLS